MSWAWFEKGEQTLVETKVPQGLMQEGTLAEKMKQGAARQVGIEVSLVCSQIWEE